jgi:hypothetical protein
MQAARRRGFVGADLKTRSKRGLEISHELDEQCNGNEHHHF